MFVRTLASLALFSASLLTSGSTLAVGEGFYFSLGIGGAVVSGERDVMLKVPKKCIKSNPELFLWSEPGDCVSSLTSDSHEESVRTDFGSGLAFQLRLGYNIEGFVSVEGFIAGNGDPGPGETAGIAHTGLQVRYHPVTHAIHPDDRRWGVDVVLGVGYAVGGFSPDPDVQLSDDEKAWDGIAITTGAAFNYQVSKRTEIGLDLKFVFPRFTSYIANWDKDFVEEPEEVPFTMIFLPTVQINFVF